MTFAPPPNDFARLPLNSLDAVAFDLETTGLDTNRARVIEIGAVRIRLGRVCSAESFSTLIDPGIPIPAAVAAVHGLTDSAVAGAARFRAAAAAFASWAGAALFIGFGSDFDLAVLKAEHSRSGMLWSPPRTLDLMRLVPLTSIRLPNYGLETVAGKLGVQAENRHRALSDAVITAEVFLALIPLLREIGINSFAEAERAASKSSKISQPLLRERVSKPADLVNLDSFPFRRCVRDIMSDPPEITDDKATMSAAIARMAEGRISSLFVRSPDGSVAGIITDSDILRAVARDGGDALGKSVDEFCSRPLLTVAADEFVYRAIVEMAIKQISHLGVVDDAGRLVGAATAHDVFSSRGLDAVSLGRGIHSATSAAELGRIWSDLSNVAKALAREAVDARSISAIVSRELRALTQRACELAEEELGPPPLPYAMLVLGSAGRGESLLAMDQDNAIVYANDPAGKADTWFADLGSRAAATLDAAGVRFCGGGVMGSNAAWRRDAQSWRREIGRWLSRTSPDDILHADIFFDSVCVHGDSRLADLLHRDATEAAAKATPFLRLLAQRACAFDDPTGIFGRWRLDGSGRIDLKKCGIMPIFSAARAAALQHRIVHRSTLRRLGALRELRPDQAQTCDDLIAAHGILLAEILDQQLRDMDSGVAPSNRVAPSELESVATEKLKWALGRVPQVAALLGVPTL